MSETALEAAFLNLLELAAVEDTPPFARLLCKRAGGSAGSNPDGAWERSTAPRRPAKVLGED